MLNDAATLTRNTPAPMRLAFADLATDERFCKFKQLHIGGDDAAIVRTSTYWGEALGLRVVTEGVETLETWHGLAAMGCDAAQG